MLLHLCAASSPKLGAVSRPFLSIQRRRGGRPNRLHEGNRTPIQGGISSLAPELEALRGPPHDTFVHTPAAKRKNGRPDLKGSLKSAL
ncbi:hypothetical protein SS05631_c19450 [Sinorhizobium sp. CCBAU 05631]|nr:hypothetical protein SS05631_c19450 [Sinorhizobium sp. CCBAU 05631]